ncbi:MAG: universal stress protein [Bacteroidetes bacterium]|nr:universal stress protein [Bacteroidota bacterium]
MENQLVTLLRITTPQLGSFVKDKLESNGIEVFFTNEGLTLGSNYDPSEVLLKVKARQSEKAVQTLLQIHKDYDLDMVEKNGSFKDLKKILVPVKLSESCIELCKYAIALAKKTKAELKLLYVYEDPTLNAPVRYTTSWEKHVRLELEDANKKAQLKLVNFSLELKKKIPADLFNSVKLHYRMLKGTPENVIADASERYHPDAIIMGTKGKLKPGEFLERTTIRVIEHSNYPVLVVPFYATFKGKEKINVMYATDFYDTDNSSLNKLLKILQPYEKKIHCVHIDLHNDVHLQKKMDELNKMLENEYSEYKIQCVLFESDNVVKGFDEFVEKNDIDLISFSKIRRSAFYKMFHSDHLAKLITTKKVPMLIFPV